MGPPDPVKIARPAAQAMEIRGYAFRERAVRRVLLQCAMQPTETLRAALDKEPNVVLGLALDGSIVFLNREWSLSARRDGDHPGLRSESMLGRPYLDSVAGALKVRVAAALAQAAALARGPTAAKGSAESWRRG